jgi:hypothetical protein
MAAAGATRRLLSPDLVKDGQRGGDPRRRPGRLWAGAIPEHLEGCHVAGDGHAVLGGVDQ